jgi:hypothetical protein
MLALAHRANDRGECWPSIRRIAADAGLPDRTVTRNLPAIVASGELAVMRQARIVNGEGGPQHVNVYRVTPPQGVDTAPTPSPPQRRGQVAAKVWTGSRKGVDPTPTEPKRELSLEPKRERRGANRPIEIRDYPDIHNPAHDPVAVALGVTKDADPRAAPAFRKELARIGRAAFLSAVAEVWGEWRAGEWDNPGAGLTMKLKALPGRQEAAP